MAILPRVIYRLNIIPIRVPANFFKTIKQKIQKLIWRQKIPRIAKVIMRKISKNGGLILPNLKTHYRPTIVKVACNWNQNRHTDQLNRIMSPEISPYTYGQLIFDKGAKNIKWK